MFKDEPFVVCQGDSVPAVDTRVSGCRDKGSVLNTACAFSPSETLFCLDVAVTSTDVLAGLTQDLELCKRLHQSLSN